MAPMISFSRCLAVGATLGMVLSCSSSSPKATGSGGTGNTSPSGGSDTSNGGADTSNGGADTTSGGGEVSGPSPTGTSSAASIVAKLGRKGNFLIGMGSDYDAGGDHSKDGAYLLGTTLDLHYGYLVGLGGKGGWPDWNTGGTFVNVLTDSADAKGVAPMFTLYQMAADGDGNLAGLADNAYMKAYFDGVKLMFQRIAAFGKPAVVQFEPDFWAYGELQSKDNPSGMKVNVAANATDCTGLSEDLIGMGHCLVKLGRMYAPKALIGFHVSSWGASDPNAIVTFMKAVGADKGDLLFTDVLDRDAGCYEAGTDCPKKDGVYWDETNKTSPNFHDNLAWTKTVTTGLGLPMMWWQVPFGVPSATAGGTTGHYRDNRVHYIFSHIQEFIDAGGVGAVFGAGADKQTTPTTDGGQFETAVTSYFAKPVALP
jgi:hypothetical protein